ncbi:hypothetical protein SDC9_75457 [bioreactor metagenome]|uniref:Uncharacterized protein n=1 Tax=bioreactor metagenome TaxID=1076179 RepID=A0A644YKR6_9ZZZZ
MPGGVSADGRRFVDQVDSFGEVQVVARRCVAFHRLPGRDLRAVEAILVIQLTDCDIAHPAGAHEIFLGMQIGDPLQIHGVVVPPGDSLHRDAAPAQPAVIALPGLVLVRRDRAVDGARGRGWRRCRR